MCCSKTMLLALLALVSVQKQAHLCTRSLPAKPTIAHLHPQPPPHTQTCTCRLHLQPPTPPHTQMSTCRLHFQPPTSHPNAHPQSSSSRSHYECFTHCHPTSVHPMQIPPSLHTVDSNGLPARCWCSQEAGCGRALQGTACSPFVAPSRCYRGHLRMYIAYVRTPAMERGHLFAACVRESPPSLYCLSTVLPVQLYRLSTVGRQVGGQ